MSFEGSRMKRSFISQTVRVVRFTKTGIAMAMLAVLAVCVSLPASAQEEGETVIVSTIAGGEPIFFADGQGSAARFNHPQGIAIDAAGNFYVADSGNHRIRKITPKGKVSTLAGGEKGFADGQGSAARFDSPSGIAIDVAGNLYVTDKHRVRKVTSKGEVTTLAGSKEGFADGQGSAAQFYYPSGIVIDAAGNLYLADNHRIRKVTPKGEVSTFAGGEGGFADGQGSAARFSSPRSIAIDATGNLYVVDVNSRDDHLTYNYRIRKVTPKGEVSTLADSDQNFVNEQGSSTRFNDPRGIAIDVAGNLYVADTYNGRIRKITPKGEVSTFVGGKEGFANGQGSAAQFYQPYGMVIDMAGNLYVADHRNHRIRKITPKGEVSTFAGGEALFADGQGSVARFYYPSAIAIDAAGNLYITDTGNNLIRKVTPNGIVSTLASGEKGFADAQGSAARFNKPRGIAIAVAGNLYVTDTQNHRIRKITPKGEVSTFAGGERGFADGQGSAARFNEPSGIAVDAADSLYVADRGNHRIRKITSTGVVSTLAGGEWRFQDETFSDGQGNIVWFCSPFGDETKEGIKRVRKVTPEGEVSTLVGSKWRFKDETSSDGQGSVARFCSPSGIAIDTAGNLYVADTDNHQIRKITPEGEVSTLAGGGGAGFSDGRGSAARFYEPSGIAIDATGNLYVADRVNCRIRKVTQGGEVSTLAGGKPGDFADEQGSVARFYYPTGIAIDAAGNLYVADTFNHRIRKIEIRRP